MRIQQTRPSALKKIDQRFAADHHFCPTVIQPVKVAVLGQKQDVLQVGVKGACGFVERQKFDGLVASRTECKTRKAKFDPLFICKSTCRHINRSSRESPFCDKLVIVHMSIVAMQA